MIPDPLPTPPLLPADAPTDDALPTARKRLARGGSDIEEISVKLALTTVILGGAASPRILDDIDVIRTATIRGHLRTWWRALHADRFSSPRDLWTAESAIFGRAAAQDGGRSAFDLRVEVDQQQIGNPDADNIRPYPRDGMPATPGAYVLWTAAQEQGAAGRPAAPRRNPGTVFVLQLRVPTQPPNLKTELLDAVRAWILFGGYGSRTRRGLGSVTVVDENDRSTWLPQAATRDAIKAIFRTSSVFSPGDHAPSIGDIPRLAGAAMVAGVRPMPNAEAAWETAVNWLRDFRQSPATGAREPSAPNRPGISHWPEADKMRRIQRGNFTHTPRTQHHGPPVWPRAAFGLPVGFRYQTSGRNGEHYSEPGNFELVWRSLQSAPWAPRKNGCHDRLASPLIVKALPLADGRFVPIALWLARGFPTGAVIVAKRQNQEIPGSQSQFDVLKARGDQAMFAPLNGRDDSPDGCRLRDAFLDFLVNSGRAGRVTP